MLIDVRFRGLEPSDALRGQVLRKVHAHLGRFERVIRSVHVRICDVNGPKGGRDKRCQVLVRGGQISGVVTDDLSEDAYRAVDVALERCGRAVARELERVRSARPLLPIPQESAWAEGVLRRARWIAANREES